MAKRAIQEINASSMADIAFLLLIFFLVTTTMDVDKGITRKLPPPIDEKDDRNLDINKRNTFVVLVNSHDGLLVNGSIGDLRTLRQQAKDFLTIHWPDNPDFPVVEEVEIELLGKVFKSKGIISLQNDRGTSYDMYVQVQNELAAAVRELREEMSKDKFATFYEKLKEDKKKAINKAIPMAISEAEPVNIGGN